MTFVRKFARLTLMKLTPGLTFFDVLRAVLLYEIFGAKILYEKRARKTLMKLTPSLTFLTLHEVFWELGKNFDHNNLKQY